MQVLVVVAMYIVPKWSVKSLERGISIKYVTLNLIPQHTPHHFLFQLTVKLDLF